jgi:hypothetical protein
MMRTALSFLWAALIISENVLTFPELLIVQTFSSKLELGFSQR